MGSKWQPMYESTDLLRHLLYFSLWNTTQSLDPSSDAAMSLFGYVTTDIRDIISFLLVITVIVGLGCLSAYQLSRLGELSSRNRRLEKKLKQVNALLIHFPAGVLIMQGETILINEALEDIIGYGSRDIKNRDDLFAKLFPSNPDLAKRNYEKHKHARFKRIAPVMINDRSGNQKWLHAVYHTEDDSEVWLLHDTSAEVRLLEKLFRQNKRLKEIAIMQSHQVRKPLANILGLVHLMETKEYDEEGRILINYLKQSAEALDNIIREVVRRTYPN